MYRPWTQSDRVQEIYKPRLSKRSAYSIHSAPKGVKWYLCVAHTGDNHYRYREVILYGDKKDLLYLELGKEFSMYGGGGLKCHWQPSEREFYLLMAGEKIGIESGVKP